MPESIGFIKIKYKRLEGSDIIEIDLENSVTGQKVGIYDTEERLAEVGLNAGELINALKIMSERKEEVE